MPLALLLVALLAPPWTGLGGHGAACAGGRRLLGGGQAASSGNLAQPEDQPAAALPVQRQLKQVPAALADATLLSGVPAAAPASKDQPAAAPASEDQPAAAPVAEDQPAAEPAVAEGLSSEVACQELHHQFGAACSVGIDRVARIFPRGSTQLPTVEQLKAALAALRAGGLPSSTCCSTVAPVAAARCGCNRQVC